MNHTRHFILALVWVGFSSLGTAWAEQPNQPLTLKGTLVALEDFDGSMTPNSVWSKIEAGEGTVVNTDTPDYGVTDSTYWFSIPVRKFQLDVQEEWVLEVGFTRLRDVRYFSMNNSGEVDSCLLYTSPSPRDRG